MSYFEEKSEEISVNSMTSFGIGVITRYGKAWQMAEMLMFTSALSARGLHPLVSNVFYDSKSDCCSFEFSQEISPDEKDGILACAEKHISQFDWDGYVLHGGPLGST
ncbi:MULTISPECIES: hypothetical protein [Xanthomonas]|uniref:hypothetical protein n=1 Tax=Xanthomonas TaxID=338 RepID=UPI000CABB6BF|nr:MULTISPECIES: hypothetical protein [Xanthomonas]SOT93772.1 hypothetical protein CFBP6773_00296 [Xanthomonas arboricola pv. fragariae]